MNSEKCCDKIVSNEANICLDICSDNTQVCLDETTICFVCQDEATENNEFAPDNICNCKGSIRIHKSCFNILKDKEKCCICKTSYNINPNTYRKRVDSKELVEEIWVNGSKAEYFIDKNSMKQGFLKVYFNNGNTWMLEEYKDDKLNGTRKIFSPNHKICRIQQFKNGELVEDSGNFNI
jgi:hypothetical protein